MDLAGGIAVTSSPSSAVLHIRHGNTGNPLKRPVRPSPSPFPFSAAFDVARGAAQSVTASQASPPHLILSAQAAHSCGLHPRPCRPLPDQGPGAVGGHSNGPASRSEAGGGQEEQDSLSIPANLETMHGCFERRNSAGLLQAQQQLLSVCCLATQHKFSPLDRALGVTGCIIISGLTRCTDAHFCQTKEKHRER